MCKPTMATRLLLLILLAVSTVGGAAAAGASPSWCVCRLDASDAALQSTIDYACGNGADCAPLGAGAPCHSPDTPVARCSYAANSYFHRQAKANKDVTCDFGGAATLTDIDPSSKNCTYPATAAASTTAAIPPAASKAASWCVCKPGLSDEEMLGTLDYACGHGADCDALHPGGQCHDPDTLLAHCSYAANSYFHSSTDADCDFAGTAIRSSTDPSSGTCKYPATTDKTMSPAVDNMPLWFLLLMALAMLLVLCMVLLYLADCWSSTPPMISDDAAGHVQEETRTTAVAERPLYLVDYGSSTQATVSGGAAVRVQEETSTTATATATEERPLCLTECGSSTLATVSGGTVVRAQEVAAPAAEEEEEEERPATTTCIVCSATCTNEGPHRISCIPRGHVYCRSCLEDWLLWSQQRGYSIAKCPCCRRNYQRKEIIELYGLDLARIGVEAPSDLSEEV